VPDTVKVERRSGGVDKDGLRTLLHAQEPDKLLRFSIATCGQNNPERVRAERNQRGSDGGHSAARIDDRTEPAVSKRSAIRVRTFDNQIGPLVVVAEAVRARSMRRSRPVGFGAIGLPSSKLRL
jgi:hypothetical protein